MITLNNISKSYGKRVLFDNLSLVIDQGRKIGFIGANGAGKSTLFSIILGETEPSSGSVQMNRGTRIGYLPQESSFNSTHTVLGELTEGHEVIKRLKSEKEVLENEGKAGTNRYGEIFHELEVLDYFNLEHKAKKILSGLEFKEKDYNRPINELSGGWQMRTLLAKLLVLHYDLLLLDEPTNYLDLNAALWLKDYLKGVEATFIMISHDKAYLNEVTNETIILENGKIADITGNYQHYEQIKEEKRIFLTKQFKEQEKKRKQLEDFCARFHAQPNKAAAVRSKRMALERMDEIVVPEDLRSSIGDFHFPDTQKSGRKVINLDKISKAYGQLQVYKDFDFEIEQGEKAVLVGDNGAGKSTLLKIIAGIVEIDSGNRTVGHNVHAGYFSQTRMDVLSPDNTVLEEACSAARGFVREEQVRTILGAFLFRGDDVYKKVTILSGGEKSRLILAKLLVNPPNFLLLDEPTTHLDVDAVDVLIKALNAYAGTLVFISHDIHFVRSVANNVYYVKDGQVRKFPGNFDYFLDKKARGEISFYEMKQGGVQKINVLTIGNVSAQNSEEDKNAHNQQIKKQIEELKKEREKLAHENYVKSRIIATPRTYRDNQLIEEYVVRLQDIEARLTQINEEIRELKKKKI